MRFLRKDNVMQIELPINPFKEIVKQIKEGHYTRVRAIILRLAEDESHFYFDELPSPYHVIVDSKDQIRLLVFKEGFIFEFTVKSDNTIGVKVKKSTD